MGTASRKCSAAGDGACTAVPSAARRPPSDCFCAEMGSAGPPCGHIQFHLHRLMRCLVRGLLRRGHRRCRQRHTPQTCGDGIHFPPAAAADWARPAPAPRQTSPSPAARAVLRITVSARGRRGSRAHKRHRPEELPSTNASLAGRDWRLISSSPSVTVSSTGSVHTLKNVNS